MYGTLISPITTCTWLHFFFQEQPAAYCTGKKKYAIKLQAVCASDLSFTDVFAGYPGSVQSATARATHFRLFSRSRQMRIIRDRTRRHDRKWIARAVADCTHLLHTC